MEGQITVTKLQRAEHGWTANINGVPVMTLGEDGRMSIWVTKPRRSDKKMHEVTPPARRALVSKVAKAMKAEAEGVGA